MSQISDLRVEGRGRNWEEAKRSHNSVDSFDPMNIYDVMKEEMWLKILLVRFCACDALFLLLIRAGPIPLAFCVKPV